MISFIIYGEPTPKGRAKKSKNLKVLYTPTETRIAENNFRAQTIPFRPKEPYGVNIPLRLGCVFYRSIPKSFSKKKYQAALHQKLYPTQKPDTDNYLKLVKDAMKGIFYHDDSQICIEYAVKKYSDTPRVEITLDSLK